MFVCLSAALLPSQATLITAKSFGVSDARADEESGGEFRRCCGGNLTLGGFLLECREGKIFHAGVDSTAALSTGRLPPRLNKLKRMNRKENTPQTERSHWR